MPGSATPEALTAYFGEKRIEIVSLDEIKIILKTKNLAARCFDAISKDWTHFDHTSPK